MFTQRLGYFKEEGFWQKLHVNVMGKSQVRGLCGDSWNDRNVNVIHGSVLPLDTLCSLAKHPGFKQKRVSFYSSSVRGTIIISFHNKELNYTVSIISIIFVDLLQYKLDPADMPHTDTCYSVWIACQIISAHRFQSVKTHRTLTPSRHQCFSLKMSSVTFCSRFECSDVNRMCLLRRVTEMPDRLLFFTDSMQIYLHFTNKKTSLFNPRATLYSRSGVATMVASSVVFQ